MTFRTKLGAAICLPLIIIGLFFALYFPQREEGNARTRLVQTTEGLAVTLAPLLATTASFYQEMPSAKDDLTNQLKVLDKQAAYAAVLSPTNELLADFSDGSPKPSLRGITPSLASTFDRDEYLVVSRPLSEKDQVVGALVLAVSRKGIGAAKSEAQVLVFSALAVMLAVAFLLAWWATRAIAGPVVQTSHELVTLAQGLLASARQQEAAAGQSAVAVEQTQRSMAELQQSAAIISSSCEHVVTSAEQALQGNQLIESRIVEFGEQSAKVGELSAAIALIAERTDILALNAGLEGTRAGEAGKGFSLVAEELRRLAERVLQAAEGIRKTVEVTDSRSAAANDASRHGLQLSDQVTRSARQISSAVETQGQATHQVTGSMDEMNQLLRHNLGSIRETSEAAERLRAAAARLVDTMGKARAN